MLYIIIFVIGVWIGYHALIALKRYYKTRIKVIKKQIKIDSVYVFLFDFKNKINNHSNPYWHVWGNYPDPVLASINSYEYEIEEFLYYFKQIEDTLLDEKVLEQIKTWDLKMCDAIWYFINEGLHKNHLAKNSYSRIQKGKSSLADHKMVESESVSPVKILAHKEVIGVTYLYLSHVDQRINEILSQMYELAIENEDQDMLVDAHLLRVHFFGNIFSSTNKEAHDLLFSNEFQFDLFKITGIQIEDQVIQDKYIQFFLSGGLKKYIS